MCSRSASRWSLGSIYRTISCMCRRCVVGSPAPFCIIRRDACMRFLRADRVTDPLGWRREYFTIESLNWNISLLFMLARSFCTHYSIIGDNKILFYFLNNFRSIVKYIFLRIYKKRSLINFHIKYYAIMNHNIIYMTKSRRQNWRSIR